MELLVGNYYRKNYRNKKKMKNKLKIGDRVATYHINSEGLSYRRVGTVDNIYELIDSTFIIVKLCNSNYLYVVTPEECKKLKPKKKSREVWVNVFNTIDLNHRNIKVYTYYRTKEEADINASIFAYGDRVECVHFVEKLEK